MPPPPSISSRRPFPTRPNTAWTLPTRAARLISRVVKAQQPAEFQKMLDHRGLMNLCPQMTLAHLGLAGARALTGDTAGSRTAYQDFFGLWKDADPDIPILKLAKAEYAKLQ